MAKLDALGDEPPLENLQAESALAREIQEEIKKKLQTEYSHAGTEETLTSVLPEYIKVLVCNSKPKPQVVDDLQLFLQDSAPKFVEWLWQLLADRNPNRTHSAFGGKDAMDEDGGRPRRKNRVGADATMRARRAGHERYKRQRAEREEYPSGAKGFRDALQSAVADGREERRMRRRPREDAEAPARRERRRQKEEAAAIDTAPSRARRTLRARAADPDRTQRLRDEWEQMRLREQRERQKAKTRGTDEMHTSADRDLLSPEDTGVRNTTFTITMDNLDPTSVPSIAHYEPLAASADSAGGLGASGLASALAGLSGGAGLGLSAQQMLAALGGKGKGMSGKGFGGKGKSAYSGPVYGRGKGSSGALGGAVYGRGGGSPHMTLDKTGSADAPAYKKRLAYAGGAKGGAKGKGGGFGHLTWEPGKTGKPSSGDDAAGESEEKDAAARLVAKLDAPLSASTGAKHKVWVNPKLKKAESETAGTAMETG